MVRVTGEFTKKQKLQWAGRRRKKKEIKKKRLYKMKLNVK